MPQGCGGCGTFAEGCQRRGVGVQLKPHALPLALQRFAPRRELGLGGFEALRRVSQRLGAQREFGARLMQLPQGAEALLCQPVQGLVPIAGERFQGGEGCGVPYRFR